MQRRRILDNAGPVPDEQQPRADALDSVGVLRVVVESAVATADRFLLLGQLRSPVR